MFEKHICPLCHKEFIGYGNNPEPLASYDQRCCDECNTKYVIPARILHINNIKELKKIHTYEDLVDILSR